MYINYLFWIHARKKKISLEYIILRHWKTDWLCKAHLHNKTDWSPLEMSELRAWLHSRALYKAICHSPRPRIGCPRLRLSQGHWIIISYVTSKLTCVSCFKHQSLNSSQSNARNICLFTLWAFCYFFTRRWWELDDARHFLRKEINTINHS